MWFRRSFPSDVDEIALLHAIGRGDRQALARLYRSYQPRLGRFLGRMTRRIELIDEVINDSFWVVWQGAAEFRGEARVSTWLMGIAYRQMLKALRDQGDVAQPEAAEALQPAVDPVGEHELRDWLLKGLALLPEEQRLALELAYGLGHSMEEIAAITDEPLSTIKARLFHARVKLRNLLPELAQRKEA